MSCVLFLASLVLAGTGEPAVRGFTFAKKEIGKTPAGWTTARTNVGKGSVWKVVEDKTAPSKAGCALAQVAEGHKSVFNLCIADGPRFTNGELSVYVKSVKGMIDQGGGIVWRYQNADNYYIARMNPLEKNLRFYAVLGGKRIQLATTENDIVVLPGTWRKLTVRHVGDHVQVFLDDQKLIDVKDTTFTKAGAVGLWTKADAETRFDQFVIRAADGKKN